MKSLQYCTLSLMWFRLVPYLTGSRTSVEAKCILVSFGKLKKSAATSSASLVNDIGIPWLITFRKSNYSTSSRNTLINVHA